MESGGESSTSLASAPIIEPEVALAQKDDVYSYVKAASLALLAETRASELEEALKRDDSLTKFIGDSQAPVLAIEKITTIKDSQEGDEEVVVTFNVRNEVEYKTERSTQVVFIKRTGLIEADKPIPDQVRVTVLNEGNPYETLLAILGKAMTPFFKSFTRETAKGERDGDKLVPAVEKSLNEAEVALLHLQQNIEIPEINLVINPHIQGVIAAAAAKKEKPKVDDLGAGLIEDSDFLNSLQTGVNRWIKEIQKVTKLDRDPSSGTALQEMRFWFNLERALQKIQQKRDADEVTLTLEALKCGKRFHAIVSFDTDTGLKQMMATVADYNQLMKDLPLNELMSATDLEGIGSALVSVFSHLNKKIRQTKYPFMRLLAFIEAISRDVATQVLKVLGNRRLMHISMSEFDQLMNSCFLVFSKWDDQVDKVHTSMRELNKKKRDEHLKMTRKMNPIHKKLEQRLNALRMFRRSHEQLRTVIGRVLRQSAGAAPDGDAAAAGGAVAEGENASEAVHAAYEIVKEVDCLDVTPEGSACWESAARRYEDQIERVETAITARLRDQLGAAKNAKEMFAIFSRYNALFVRPHIRGAIREYQTQLIARVKEDIEALQAKFSTSYEKREEVTTPTHDIPPFSDRIIWIKQIERQLSLYMKRVEDVLGKEWESHVDGRHLKTLGNNFRSKLNTQPLFDSWVASVQTKDLNTPGRIFVIEKVARNGKSVLQLKVNFSKDIIVLHKEVRNLKGMNFRIPMKIVNAAHLASQHYPSATSLLESMRTYENMNTRLAQREGIDILMASYKKEIQSIIAEGNVLTWESFKIEPYVMKMAEAINNYEEKVEELMEVIDRIDSHKAALETCQYSTAVVESHLTSLQKAVDQLSLGHYSNLNTWVERLDKELEATLARRVEEAIRLWSVVFENGEEAEEARENNVPLPVINPVLIEVRLTAQTIYISPTMEDAKAALLEQLYEWHGVVTGQARISSTRFQLTIDQQASKRTYKEVLAKLPGGLTLLDKAFNTIEKLTSEVDEYVAEWLRYQALWDLQAETIYEKLGTDVSKWMRTLVEIRKSRSTFDTQDTRKEMFPIVVDYAKVQSKVTLKYDYWHKEVLHKFGNMLGGEMHSFFENISKWRTELEGQGVDSASTSDAVALITYVQTLKKQTKVGEEQVEQFRAAQRLLSQQRFQFPGSWLYAENIEGEWSALSDILMRKDSSIQSQISNLQTKIKEEDELVEKRMQETLGEWDKTKPVEGAQRPVEALALLQQYESRLDKLKEDREKMRKARNALDMPDRAPLDADKLSVAGEELADLKGVWQALSPIYEQIDEMKEKTWLSVQPRKLRQTLDELVNQLKHLPVKYKSYKSYEYAKQMMHNYSKMNMLVVELKSEALKERHWRQMMKELRVNWNLQDLTLGQVWDADIQRHENSIKQILLVAQGELALEEFLKQMREYWQSYEVELVNYQNKTRLIKGWDDLFNKLKEHQNSLAAMKLSPYYKQFEEDALSWEEKLNRISAMFDVWIDVQRRWVYLEGLFSGSADIATLLPVESARFSSISTEFVALMKKVTAAPRILDVVHMQGTQRLLERLADMLAKIQKALGEYLERERSSFPRFYFVGDEDLLEIMGNSKDVSRLQKHLKKMFAGVNAIEINEEDKTITALLSREGEKVALASAVVTNGVRINEWLRALENEMRHTLARSLTAALVYLTKMNSDDINVDEYTAWLDQFPSQIVCMAADVWWSNQVESALADGKDASTVETAVNNMLQLLADCVLKDQPVLRRKKMEFLITELVHKRDTCRGLVAQAVTNNQDFAWLKVMRFYMDPKQTDATRCCIVKMANAAFHYGFEYLGMQERLVRTPLTDRCYLTMTQALHLRMGGSPFGPAGTGKTESVKALGHQLGRFVLVFNCDETFDFQAMGRILVGLCQVGAWGCFDEFNRLEERMLSAVSQQIQTIQEAVRGGGEMQVDLVGKRLNVNANIGIFITMNPGYSGRSNLPDNLKALFRSLAMTQPDRQLIAQVMLFSQGFRSAETLSNKIVPLFILCKEQLSSQCHYDFGLRALKYVLVSAGNIKRERLARDGDSSLDDVDEQKMLIQSVCETLVPKLVSEDIVLLHSLLNDVFPAVQYTPNDMTELRQHIAAVCDEQFACHSDVEGELGAAWVQKVLQLYQITNLNHGLMLVGASGSGKTTAWKVLLKALEKWEKVDGVAHVIDAKAMSKDDLYGVMDPNTREWTDGLFTSIIRRIIDNVRGETSRRQWVIFDGDVDPEWVENLNSVLDDNKLLTLPNGERLAIPPNVRIIFEVADLKYATLATVSRCGMVWFSEEVVTTEMLLTGYLNRLRCLSVENEALTALDATPSRAMAIQRMAASALSQHLSIDGLVALTLEYALSRIEHIMTATSHRLLSSFFAMMNYSIRTIIDHDSSQIDFPLPAEQIETFVCRSMLCNLVWAFSGDTKWKGRQEMSDYVRRTTTLQLPPNEQVPIVDYQVALSGDWQPWLSKVPQIEVESHRVAASDLVVPTVDTVRHEMLLSAWLSEHKPLVLCGPPGSGKTMTLLAALRSQQDMDVVNVNFSSSTTPELLMQTLDHYCEYRRTPNGVVLAPVQLSRWLVVFCDEINLPSPDKYGTQRVISFLRQLVQMNGFYRTSDHSWVSLERVQFVGACNPPTDAGRHPMTLRFLRHVPIVYVDYPAQQSLIQIYGTFNRAMLKMQPGVRSLAEALTNAMVDVYHQSQEHLTSDIQPHYVYSPRELTRWVRGIAEAIAPLDSITPAELVRLWAHEALRLFQDRLVLEEERKWTDELIDGTAEKYFNSSCDLSETLRRPILYSCWLSKHYLPVSRDQLKEYVSARLKGFYEEELDVQLVLFDQMLDHVLRIDRIYRQPQGHLLLIGTSGSGKTTLSRFVAWLNGLSVVQLKVHSKYTAADFDEDMRSVLRRAGCKNEKICFIMDESNMLETGFLERLNTLLANGEVPGLFEGDEHTTLMSQIKEGAQRQGLMLDSHDELYKWFTMQVMRNLHVVFTMNPSESGLRDRAATSPALFNRCVLNWAGDWSDNTLYQVGCELTQMLDMECSGYEPPLGLPAACELLPSPPTYREAVINTLVHAHKVVKKLNEQENKRGRRTTATTPRHFLDLIKHYTKLLHEKRRELEEEKVHLNIGLNKISETEEQVKELQKSLTLKSKELEEKKSAANAKLKEMLADQQKAEEEKRLSEQLQKELAEQLEQIGIKKAEVQKDLSKVEPAVEEAQTAVKGIKKATLVEVRSMASPPAGVKLALEAICLLLGENVGSDWKAIRGVMVKEDFMPRILSFDTDSLTPELIKQMEKYANNPDFDFEKINRASQACGPMVKWCKAQLLYSEMLHKVDPLRNELKRLETDANKKTKQGEEVKERIIKLEQSISAYKEEYAQLIGQAEHIKSDLAAVEEKVMRSTQLLSSLRTEFVRWSASRDSFSAHMETLIGDALLSAAFLSYSGYLDQQLRDVLFNRWTEHAQKAGIRFRSDIARIEYLSTADERIQWNKNGLPVDDLCTENAIMLHRFNRYPLIIDPSGQAVDFLMKEFAHKNIQKTSFLDDSFRKNLESALRFGNSLLVQDVESYDAIVNPVLNREVKRTGGRVLITIGDQDIDLSPAFQIFLITRDASAEFAADVCSRVTFVNFTVTSSSLASQCLNQTIRSEQPEVDKKRSDLLKLQGEFAVRLRQLEKALLAALNESKGKILDDNSVIATLEKLKTEAQEIATKAAETEKVMAEVDAVSAQYQPLAAACSQIYHTLEQLNEVHFLYQYSLDFLLDMFTTALETPDLQGDYTQRLTMITATLFKTVYSRVSRGMLHTDKMLLALLLMRIRLRGVTTEKPHDAEWDVLLGRAELYSSKAKAPSSAPPASLSPECVANFTRIQHLPAFQKLWSKMDGAKMERWMALDNPESEVPTLWEDVDGKMTEHGALLHSVLVVWCGRPDRLLAAVHRLVSHSFGEAFFEGDTLLKLDMMVEKEVASSQPILFCSAAGFDASTRVEDLAVEEKKEITAIAIGSAEGFSQAEKALASSSKSGRWLLLKNVHLAPSWLGQLEKRLHTLKPHPAFRLFMTAEIHPKLPSSVLRASRLVVMEPATGLKASVLRSLSSIPAQRMSKGPAERSRLYLLVCWLHALVQERLRYAPLGWAHAYEFSEADLRVACDTLDTAVDAVAQGRANVAPDRLPWKTLLTLFSQCIYGGKIDNAFDQTLLDCMLEQIFTAKSFEPDHKLITRYDGEDALKVPDASRRDVLLDWADKIHSTQLPSWLGLPNNAEKVLLQQRADKLLKNMLAVADDELAFATVGEEGGEAMKPQWMAQLIDLAGLWLKNLPKELTRMKRTVENIKDPLFRFFEREVNLGANLIARIRADLVDVMAVCRAEKKQSNETRALISYLQKGQVPTHWMQYTVPRETSLKEWLSDLAERMKQLARVASSASLRNEEVWLGGVFTAEAFITATRQQVAQTNTWSLEQLHLHVHLGRSGAKDVFRVSGMQLRGARSLGGNKLELSDEVTSPIDVVEMAWRKEPAEGAKLPLYLYGERRQLVASLSFQVADPTSFYQRGIAIVANSNL
ncbi:dhc-1 [Pristionchus pacificus]|uniref:Dynein heavy chain, cytoplasmic n=1 Tax=Pristionchus pacificus TaxID=54126 RepID=A0A2A6BMW6_PRIPA|nr:dhc-1 [Pristionchus pacificus]|eukprot:PDM67255.1 dhc-1 [Pristionchus pacificus]